MSYINIATLNVKSEVGSIKEMKVFRNANLHNFFLVIVSVHMMGQSDNLFHFSSQW